MNELRFAFRQLVKSPGFTIIAVSALAIGIGANTAIFSVVNAVLLKPLPYPHSEQLVAVGAVNQRDPRVGGGLDSISFPDFFDFRAQNKSFENLAVYRNDTLALAAAGEAQSLRGQRVSSEFFDVLGVKPQLGRTFRREEEGAGGGPNGLTVVLSYDFWQRQFKGAANALGGVVLLDGEPHLVIGVMPRGFQFPIEADPVDVYTSTSAYATSTDGEKPATEQRGNHSMRGIGRLKPGVNVAQAQAELDTIAAALERQYPDSNTGFRTGVQPLREDLIGDVSSALYVLFGAVGCVLLIASANVANLLLARATVRAKEMALRSALGASRGRIIRQLLTESVLLSAVGGLLGLFIAAWGTDLLVSLVPQNIPRVSEIRLDGVVLAFTLVVSLATGVLFGLAPAFQASRLDLQAALNESGAGPVGARRESLARRTRHCGSRARLALAHGGGIAPAKFRSPQPGGFRFATGAPLHRFRFITLVLIRGRDDSKRFFDQVLPELKALPGVEAASTIFPLPLSGSNISTSFDIEERPLPEGQQPAAATRIVERDYLSTVGIPVLRGRGFDARDERKSKQVMVVNQSFADKFFPGEDVIGKRLTPGISVDPGDSVPREIVGVVGNVKFRSLRDDFTPEMYMPATQMPFSIGYLVVRTATANPASVTSAVRSGVARIDPGVPLTRVQVFDDYLARSLARPRFNALLLAIFAGVALLLTAIGIYGVMAYSVAQRRQEIGIRMALGAQRSHVLRLIVGGGMKLTAIGVLLGLAAALALTRVLKSLLYDVAPFDAPTLGAVAFLLGLIALLACWFPARRAAGVNPIIALREG